MDSIRSFVCIGAGNVASHLSARLVEKGFLIKQVYSRSIESGQDLAMRFKVSNTNNVRSIIPDADFYLVSISDLAVPAILSELKVRNKLIIHTAGSLGVDVFKDGYKSFGVLYPLQTFSKKRDLDISKVPLLIEGSDKESTELILEIAKNLSQIVIQTDSIQRKCIHIAAVFASNFTNFMYTAAYEILKDQKLDFELLYPLMEETFRKAQSENPAKGQTGPAIRGDFNNMDGHIKFLSYNPDLQNLYTFISSNIATYYSKERFKHLNNE